MTDSGEWARLAGLLDDDEAVTAAVRAALSRGADPWEALLDGLDEVGALAYLQADDSGIELTDALAQLPRVFAVQPDLDDATDSDHLPTATRIADAVLSDEGLRVVRLVEDEDSWPLVVLPAGRVDDVVALVRSLGNEALPGG